jgi:hypothetical protein
MGTFAVPEQWTDQGNPPVSKSCNNNLPILDFQCLLDLRQIVKNIDKKKKSVDNEDK